MQSAVSPFKFDANGGSFYLEGGLADYFVNLNNLPHQSQCQMKDKILTLSFLPTCQRNLLAKYDKETLIQE
jgi:hypothetical protein